MKTSESRIKMTDGTRNTKYSEWGRNKEWCGWY